MRIKPFKAVYPNLDYVTSSDAFFARVKFEYPDYKKNGFFDKKAQEAIYIYEIESGHRNYTGLIACSDIEDYLDGAIKKHENTLAAKEQQQMQLMISRDAIVKPVLLTYPGVDKINDLVQEYKNDNACFYETSFFEDQQTHRFWEIKSGALISQLQQLFLEKVTKTYIADGHHRCSTLALMHKRDIKKSETSKYDRILSAFFPTDQLEVLDFNRVVQGLNENSLTMFMAKMSQLFDIEILNMPGKPKKKHELTMFINREWFRLTWKESVLNSYKKTPVLLDASMLDEKVMKWILGIENVRSNNRIKYIEGVKGLEGFRLKTLKHEMSVGFCLFPVELNDLIAVADLNRTMPPKSTWFEPRMKNGLIVQEFS